MEELATHMLGKKKKDYPKNRKHNANSERFMGKYIYFDTSTTGAECRDKQTHLSKDGRTKLEAYIANRAGLQKSLTDKPPAGYYNNCQELEVNNSSQRTTGKRAK